MGAAIALGLAHALAFAPWPAWWLELASLAGLLLVQQEWLGNSSLRARLFVAAGFAMGWLASGLSWLFVSMHDYGGLSGVLAASAVLCSSFIASATVWPSARPSPLRTPPDTRSQSESWPTTSAME
jgi:apolipoprotein N-acyltransferase